MSRKKLKRWQLKRLDRTKIRIYGEWIFTHMFFYLALSLVLPGFIASTLALIITVAAFFDDSNAEQIERVKRPVLWLKKPKVIH